MKNPENFRNPEELRQQAIKLAGKIDLELNESHFAYLDRVITDPGYVPHLIELMKEIVDEIIQTEPQNTSKIEEARSIIGALEEYPEQVKNHSFKLKKEAVAVFYRVIDFLHPEKFYHYKHIEG